MDLDLSCQHSWKVWSYHPTISSDRGRMAGLYPKPGEAAKSCYSMAHLRKAFKRLFRKPILPPLRYGRKAYRSVWGEINLETCFWRHASRQTGGEIMGTTCSWTMTISAAQFPAHLAVAAVAGFADCFRSSHCRKRCQVLALHAVSWASSHPFLTCSCKGSNYNLDR